MRPLPGSLESLSVPKRPTKRPPIYPLLRPPRRPRRLLAPNLYNSLRPVIWSELAAASEQSLHVDSGGSDPNVETPKCGLLSPIFPTYLWRMPTRFPPLISRDPSCFPINSLWVTGWPWPTRPSPSIAYNCMIGVFSLEVMTFSPDSWLCTFVFPN